MKKCMLTIGHILIVASQALVSSIWLCLKETLGNAFPLSWWYEAGSSILMHWLHCEMVAAPTLSLFSCPWFMFLATDVSGFLLTESVHHTFWYPDILFKKIEYPENLWLQHPKQLMQGSLHGKNGSILGGKHSRDLALSHNFSLSIPKQFKNSFQINSRSN